MSTSGPLIISVTGAHSKVGKTTLCSILLKELKGFGAIKFTKTPLYSSLTEDPEILKQNGKDTALFLESGAEKVIWVRSPYDGLGNTLETAVGRLIDCRGIIVEGNSPVDFLNPHLVVFIIGADGRLKSSAEKAAKKAGIVIINSKKKAEKPGSLTPLIRKNAKVFRIDLTERKGEMNEFLSSVKEKINRETY